MRRRGSSPTLALAAALALAACGDSAHRVAVALSTDGSCAVDSPADIEMPCDANVGIWLLDQDGAVLDQACVAYSADAATLADLPRVLQGSVEFTGVAAPLIQLELAIYSPALPGCPRLFAGTLPAVMGLSDLVAPDRTDRIDLVLSCLGPGDPGDPTDECEFACQDASDECSFANDDLIAGCEAGLEECQLGCDGQRACLPECSQGYEQCLAGALDCDARYAECVRGCGVQPGDRC